MGSFSDIKDLSFVSYIKMKSLKVMTEAMTGS